MDHSDNAAEEFSRSLNSPQWLPETAYRRNTGIYRLVCYVNTVVGACLSENYRIASLFIARATEYMRDFSPHDELEERYYALVAGYFSHVINNIRQVAPHVSFDSDRIPATLFTKHLIPEPAAVLERSAHELYFWRAPR
jgi:hypothetical protein